MQTTSIGRRLRRLAAWNWRWLRHSQLGWATRLGYYPRLAVAMASHRLRRGRPGRVRYLGHAFRYDNSLVPLLLLGYPDEIETCILDNTAHPIRHALDIGGNLGQFALTLAVLGDPAAIDVFEPNRAIFDLLRRNVAGCSSIRCFNLGVGPPGTQPLYYTPGRSVISSFIAENARYRPGSRLEAQETVLVADVGEVTGRSHYDLVKIDVEGFEYEVLEALSGVTMRYLYLEITGLAKKKSYVTSDVYTLLADRFGPYEIRYQTAGDARTDIFELLFEFVEGPKHP